MRKLFFVLALVIISSCGRYQGYIPYDNYYDNHDAVSEIELETIAIIGITEVNPIGATYNSNTSNVIYSDAVIYTGIANVQLDIQTNIYVDSSYSATLYLFLSNIDIVTNDYQSTLELIETGEVRFKDQVQVDLISEDLYISRISDTNCLIVDFDAAGVWYFVFNYSSDKEGTFVTYSKVWKNHVEHTISSKPIMVISEEKSFITKLGDFLSSWEGILTTLGSIAATVVTILLTVKTNINKKEGPDEKAD